MSHESSPEYSQPTLEGLDVESCAQPQGTTDHLYQWIYGSWLNLPVEWRNLSAEERERLPRISDGLMPRLIALYDRNDGLSPDVREQLLQETRRTTADHS